MTKNLGTFHSRSDRSCTLVCGKNVTGDIKVQFYDNDKSGKGKMFWFWLNTNFIENNHLVLSKAEIDKARKDKECKHYSKDFQVELWFKDSH